MRFNVVIPARYGSTRLPAKPLKIIAGKPMVQWVYENAKRSGAERVVVATDDQRILDAVKSFSGNALMTSSAHCSGTDRIAEVATQEGWSPETIVVNLQGDEPMIEGDLIVIVARALQEAREASIGTMATPIHDADDLFDPNVVKVVTDHQGLALYFSRAPIPWVRQAFRPSHPHPAQLPKGVPFFRHLGLYAYRVDALLRMAASPPSALENAEALEQLRAMSLGMRIRVAVVDTPPGHGVDTEEDIGRVEAALRARIDERADP